jgi:predicted DsbA family dithiol-disulfide isomerase
MKFLCSVILLALLTPMPALAVSDPTEVAAVVDGQQISLAAVDATIRDRLDALEQQKYELRKAALKNLITTTLLANEAGKRGIPVEKLKAGFSATDVEVAPEAVERAYAENSAALSALNVDEAKERLRIDLETDGRVRRYRERVEALEKEARIDVFLDEPRRRVEIGDHSPILGNADAKVKVVMFSDYECPYCRAAQSTVRQLTERYGGQVAVAVKQLPFENHPLAMPAARAAVCAAGQGRFWQFHNDVFAAPAITEAALQDAARTAGLDLATFDDCRTSPASEQAVLRDVLDARRTGINVTPSYLINGKVLRGPTAQVLQAAIAEELKTGQDAMRTQTQSIGSTAKK